MEINKKTMILIVCCILVVAVVFVSAIVLTSSNLNIPGVQKEIITDVTVDFSKSDISADIAYDGKAYTSYSWNVYGFLKDENELNYTITCKFYEDDNLVDTSTGSLKDMINSYSDKISLGYLYTEKNYNINKVVVEVKDNSGNIVQTIDKNV